MQYKYQAERSPFIPKTKKPQYYYKLMTVLFKRWKLIALTMFFLATIFYTRKIHQEQLQFSRSLAQQLFRDNSQPKSTYFSPDKPSVSDKASKVLVYTHIGCTFDPHLCGFLSGCKQAYKICDQSMQHKELCNVTLSGTYFKNSLGNKNHDFISHMCHNLGEFGNYDLFVKADDDLMYDPDQLIHTLSRINFDDTRALLGFLNYQENEQVVWPSGAIYAFSKQALLALCEDKRALHDLKGIYEDVHVGLALSRIRNDPQVRYFNLDNLVDVSHLQYKSSRVFVQFLQYSSCL
ncbi:hypothetical protein BX667DRAFT_501167, partial [Coemansia mojavensis]